jgi:hypothetical protein
MPNNTEKSTERTVLKNIINEEFNNASGVSYVGDNGFITFDKEYAKQQIIDRFLAWHSIKKTK